MPSGLKNPFKRRFRSLIPGAGCIITLAINVTNRSRRTRSAIQQSFASGAPDVAGMTTGGMFYRRRLR